MKPGPLSALFFLGLAACASLPTPYQPAMGPAGLGYAESPIEHDRWRVPSGRSGRQRRAGHKSRLQARRPV